MIQRSVGECRKCDVLSSFPKQLSVNLIKIFPVPCRLARRFHEADVSTYYAPASSSRTLMGHRQGAETVDHGLPTGAQAVSTVESADFRPPVAPGWRVAG